MKWISLYYMLEVIGTIIGILIIMGYILWIFIGDLIEKTKDKGIKR